MGGKGVMADNEGTGKAHLHRLDELPEGFLLLGRAGVSRLAGFVETTFVAYADAVPVVVLAVCTDLLKLTPRFHRAVPADHIVVADALPAPGSVPSVYVLG